MLFAFDVVIHGGVFPISFFCVDSDCGFKINLTTFKYSKSEGNKTMVGCACSASFRRIFYALISLL